MRSFITSVSIISPGKLMRTLYLLSNIIILSSNNFFATNFFIFQGMNMQNIRHNKYLRYLVLPSLFGTQRTKEILNVNPTIIPHREEAQQVFVFVYDYNNETLEERQLESVEDCLQFK